MSTSALRARFRRRATRAVPAIPAWFRAATRPRSSHRRYVTKAFHCSSGLWYLACASTIPLLRLYLPCYSWADARDSHASTIPWRASHRIIASSLSERSGVIPMQCVAPCTSTTHCCWPASWYEGRGGGGCCGGGGGCCGGSDGRLPALMASKTSSGGRGLYGGGSGCGGTEGGGGGDIGGAGGGGEKPSGGAGGNGTGGCDGGG